MRFRKEDFKDTERFDQLKEAVDEKLQHPGSKLAEKKLANSDLSNEPFPFINYEGFTFSFFFFFFKVRN